MPSSSVSDRRLNLETAPRFARIALGHVRREFPNAVMQVSPRSLHPIFFGSYDWHSCVHSYWLLATLYRLAPGIPEGAVIGALFDAAFVSEKIAGELSYLEPATARGFERPYGWAWLLMLQAELNRRLTPDELAGYAAPAGGEEELVAEVRETWQ